MRQRDIFGKRINLGLNLGLAFGRASTFLRGLAFRHLRAQVQHALLQFSTLGFPRCGPPCGFLTRLGTGFLRFCCTLCRCLLRLDALNTPFNPTLAGKSQTGLCCTHACSLCRLFFALE